MSTLIRPEDHQHYALVRECLAFDGLHVAMCGRDQARLQGYGIALARELGGADGLRVEAYDARRLESVIVDLMLQPFDAALSDLTRPQLSGSHTGGRRPGCVMFIPDAHALPRAEFMQLVRVAAATRKHALLLVGLFDSAHPCSDERITMMGTRVARWDLDDTTASAETETIKARWPFSLASRSFAANGQRWVAAASMAAVLALLPGALPVIDHADLLAQPAPGPTSRTGTVELAGGPLRGYPLASPATEEESYAAN